jgi:hypothetical protein
MIDGDDLDAVLVDADAVDDSEVTATGTVQAVEIQAERLSEAMGIVRQ